MKLFGSGINFYGGPGESAHKQLSKFRDKELDLQYYNMLVSKYVANECNFSNSKFKQSDDTEKKKNVAKKTVRLMIYTHHCQVSTNLL